MRYDTEPLVTGIRCVAHGTVLAVGVYDEAGDVVLHQLLQDVPGDVALTATGLRKDAHVTLYQTVDVQHHGHVVSLEHPDVGARSAVVLETQYPAYELGFGTPDGCASEERRPRYLQQSLLVLVPYHIDRCHDLVLGAVVGSGLQGLLQGHGGLPDDTADLAQHIPAVGVVGHHIIGTLHASGDGELEGVGAHVTEYRTHGIRIACTRVVERGEVHLFRRPRIRRALCTVHVHP